MEPMARPIRQKLTWLQYLDKSFYRLRQSRKSALVDLGICLGGSIFLMLIMGLVLESLEVDSVSLSVFIQGLLILLVVFRVNRINGGSTNHLGLSTRKWGMNLVWGITAAVPSYFITIMLSFVVLIIAMLLGWESAESMVESQKPMLEILSKISLKMVVPLALFVGVYEEIVFRGFLLGRLVTLTRSLVLACVISAVIFGLLHFYQGWMGIVKTTIIGFLMALLTVWRGNIWSAIVCHAGIDMFGLSLLHLLKPFMEEFLQSGGTS